VHKQIELEGVRIHYREEGEGIPLILLHGVGVTSLLWEKNIESLAKSYRVLALDLPGCGQSGKLVHFDYSLLHLALIIEKFILFLGEPKVILGGNSLGGGLALMLALKPQKQIAALVLMAPICYLQPISIGIKIARTPILGELSFFLLGKWTIRYILKGSIWDHRLITKDVVNRLTRPLYSPFWRWAQMKTLRGIVPKDVPAITQAYKSIKVPTLIVWGEKDILTPVSLAKRLHQDIPGSELKVFSDCAHIPQFEKPEEVNHLILDFLSRRL